MLRRAAIISYLAISPFLASAQTESLEQTLAREFAKDYKRNETRLVEIAAELQGLPINEI